MKAVVFYHVAPDFLVTAPLHFPAHNARIQEFHARGDLLGVGTWDNPKDGAMAVFRSRASAEAFVAEDPFVLHGVVGRHEIKDWTDVLLPG